MARRVKKVTVSLPVEVLENAQRITGMGITPTLLEGLKEIERRQLRSALARLKGKVRLDIDLEKTRR